MDLFNRSSSPSPLVQEREKRTFPGSSDKYEFLANIAQGQTCEVWEAVCKTFDSSSNKVAVKKFDLEKINDIEKIRREVQISSQNLHPNIASFHASFVSGHHLCLVMDLLEGSCLDLLKWTCPIGLKDEELVACILKQVLQGLEYIHKNGLMHRDVKAKKILVERQGNVMLADFAIAADSLGGRSNDRRGARHTFVGSPCWMAPEVLEQAGGYDSKADIWSVGITALELVNGKPPYWSMYKKAPVGVLVKVLEGNPPIEIPSHFSKSFREFVEACLQKDHKTRPTASKLLEMKLFKNFKRPETPVRDFISHLPPRAERSPIPDPDDDDDFAISPNGTATMQPPGSALRTSRPESVGSSAPNSPASNFSMTATAINLSADDPTTSLTSTAINMDFAMQTAIQHTPELGGAQDGAAIGVRSENNTPPPSVEGGNTAFLNDVNLRRLESLPTGGKSIRWDFDDTPQQQQPTPPPHLPPTAASISQPPAGVVVAVTTTTTTTTEPLAREDLSPEEETFDFSDEDEYIDDANDRTVRIPGYTSSSNSSTQRGSDPFGRGSFQSNRTWSPPLTESSNKAGRFAPIQEDEPPVQRASLQDISDQSGTSSMDDPFNPITMAQPSSTTQSQTSAPSSDAERRASNAASEDISSDMDGYDHESYLSTDDPTSSHDEAGEEIRRRRHTALRNLQYTQQPTTSTLPSSRAAATSQSVPILDAQPISTTAAAVSASNHHQLPPTAGGGTVVVQPTMGAPASAPPSSAALGGTQPQGAPVQATPSGSTSLPNTPNPGKKVEKLGRFLLKTVEDQLPPTAPSQPDQQPASVVTTTTTSTPTAASLPPSGDARSVTPPVQQSSTSSSPAFSFSDLSQTGSEAPSTVSSRVSLDSTSLATATTTPAMTNNDRGGGQTVPTTASGRTSPVSSITTPPSAGSEFSHGGGTFGSNPPSAASSVASLGATSTASAPAALPASQLPTIKDSKRRSRNFQVSVVSENEVARLAGRKPSSGGNVAIVVDSSVSPPSNGGNGGSVNVVVGSNGQLQTIKSASASRVSLGTRDHLLQQQIHSLMQQSQQQAAMLQQLLSASSAHASKPPLHHDKRASVSSETQTAEATADKAPSEPVSTPRPLTLVKELEAQISRLIQENEKLKVENEALKRQLVAQSSSTSSRTPPPQAASAPTGTAQQPAVAQPKPVTPTTAPAQPTPAVRHSSPSAVPGARQQTAAPVQPPNPAAARATPPPPTVVPPQPKPPQGTSPASSQSPQAPTSAVQQPTAAPITPAVPRSSTGTPSSVPSSLGTTQHPPQQAISQLDLLTRQQMEKLTGGGLTQVSSSTPTPDQQQQ